MKAIKSFLYLIPIIVSALIFFSCKDSITNSGTQLNPHHVRSEQEFVSNTNLRAYPGAVVVVELENLNSPPDTLHRDTGTRGVDIIPYTYLETHEHHFRLAAGSSSEKSSGFSPRFKSKLVNESSGATIYELTPDNDSVVVTIPAGNYQLYLTSLVEFGTDSLESQTVFIQPDTIFALNRGGGIGEVDFNPNDWHTLQTTGNCVNCDLTYGEFLYARLLNANLTNSNMQYCDLEFAVLTGANLTNVNISYSSIVSAGFCKTITTGIIATGVYYDNTTQCWP